MHHSHRGSRIADRDAPREMSQACKPARLLFPSVLHASVQVTVVVAGAHTAIGMLCVLLELSRVGNFRSPSRILPANLPSPARALQHCRTGCRTGADRALTCR